MLFANKWVSANKTSVSIQEGGPTTSSTTPFSSSIRIHMLSHQIAIVPSGRHQRQHSTPTAFNVPKVTHLPGNHSHHESHRRGLSLDQKTTNMPKKEITNRQEGTNTCIGGPLRHELRQKAMQETQQQHQMARPGHLDESHTNGLDAQFYKTEPTPGPAPGYAYLTNHDITNLIIGLDTDKYPKNSTYSNDTTLNMFQSFDSDKSAGYLDGFGIEMNRQNENASDNEMTAVKDMPNDLPSRQYSHDFFDNSKLQRPRTPDKQDQKSWLHFHSDIVYSLTGNIDYFPMTPDQTPFSGRGHSQRSCYSRTAESSPTRMDPNPMIHGSQRMQRGGSCQERVAAIREHAMSPAPSPPKAAPLNPRGSVDIALTAQPDLFNMASLNMDFPNCDGYNASNYSPLTNTVSSTLTSFRSSPEVAHLTLFEGSQAGINSAMMTARLSNLPSSQSSIDLGHCIEPTKEVSHSRSQSVSGIEYEECIEDTGVTVDEIASFIKGPMPDGKWECLYLECGKKFARKENIKSHVQTHLGDRQFRCKACDTRFVRQHDLKRHARIHENDKKYKCPCGTGFVRHDALTRHRQRGMCNGAFEGTPKKVIKRGRPKKSRPETKERLDKAAKTRQVVMERIIPGMTYASSISGSSDCSYPSPPDLFDTMSVGASSPPQTHQAYQDTCFVAPASLALTPPASPSHSVRRSPSPQQSIYSHTPKAASRSPSPRITIIAEEEPELPAILSASPQSSQSHGSPPELDLSSSSPITASMPIPQFDASTPLFPPSAFLDTEMDFPSQHGGDFFNKDFDLSTEIAKDCDPFTEAHFFDFDNQVTPQKPDQDARRSPQDLVLASSWANDFGYGSSNDFFDAF